jgi:hypothetical protein
MNRRSGAAFWALVLITIGVIFLLQNLGILSRNVWGTVWPVFLILFGLWVLLGNFATRGGVASSTKAIPLDGAREARLSVNHGAGLLRIASSSDPGTLVHNTFDGELRHSVRRDGDRLDVWLSQEHDWWFWMWPGNWSGRNDWQMTINRDVPLRLDIHTGASRADLDLSELKVTDLRVDTGASTIDLTVPASGHSAAHIKAGAATVRVRVPAGVAARVRSTVGMGAVNIDSGRFPYQGNVYQSPDYETATNRVELSFEGGAATFNVM